MSWDRDQTSILLMVAITSFLGTFLISAVNVALPAIELEFGMDAVRLSWLITSFLLASAMFLLPLGRLGDIKGVRRFYKTGLVIFTFTSLLCALAPGGNWLIFARYLQGIGAALTSTTGPAILVMAFSAQQRGKVLGITISAVYLGLATGPLLGGLLTEAAGWRSIFFLSAATGVPLSLGAFIILKKEVELGIPKLFRLRGLWFYFPGLILLVFGTSTIPHWSGWLMLLSGGVFLISFWQHERLSAAPLLNVQLFTKNRLFTFSNIAALINYSATFAIVFYLSLYLQKILHYTPREAGMILMTQPITMAIFSPLAGRLSDKIQARYIASSGMAMCTLGLFAFSFLGEDISMWFLFVTLFWVGLGFAFFSSPNMNTIMGSVDKTQYGVASGTSATMRVLGQMLSMTIATIFLAVFIGDISVAQASDQMFIRALQLGFLTFSLISAAGIWFSYFRKIP
jgi:EmrB/QacA subfamily drug resistance transporter